MPGEDDPALTRGFGDRGHPGVVLQGTGIGVPVRVVTELGKHPGTEDHAETGLAQIGLNVRVPAKPAPTCSANTSTCRDSSASTATNGNTRLGRHHTSSRGQLLTVQCIHDPLRGGLVAPLPTSFPQHRDHPGHGEPPALIRAGATVNTASATRPVRSSPNACSAAG